MADNVPITAGSGTSIATDDISGVHYQKVKLFDATADSSAAIPGDATNGLLVNLGANNDVTVTSGSITANAGTNLNTSALALETGGNLAGAATSLAILDDWDESDRAKTNPIVGQAGIAGGSGTVGATTVRVTLATDVALPTGSNTIGAVLGSFVTVSTDITRPADTNAYATNDALSDSTSAPTSGGFTFTNAARISGGAGLITDAIITTAADASTLLQGEIWLFNQAVTNINDNAAFAVSDTEIKTCVGKIPFTLEDAGNNGFYHATCLNIGFTCSGTANLRFLVRVKNAYTPVSAEVLTFVLKIIQVN